MHAKQKTIFIPAIRARRAESRSPDHRRPFSGTPRSVMRMLVYGTIMLLPSIYLSRERKTTNRCGGERKCGQRAPMCARGHVPHFVRAACANPARNLVTHLGHCRTTMRCLTSIYIIKVCHGNSIRCDLQDGRAALSRAASLDIRDRVASHFRPTLPSR